MKIGLAVCAVVFLPGCHFCWDEGYAILMAFPFVSAWAKMKHSEYHAKKHHKKECHIEK